MQQANIQQAIGVRGETLLPIEAISEDFRKVQQLSPALKEGIGFNIQR